MELYFERPEQDWRAVSRAPLAGWLVFYGLYLVHAVTNKDGFLVLDYVNLAIHEAGHLFFGWFGFTIGILGGTLAELLVPLFIAVYFFWRRETSGTAFAAFWFFENFLYIGTYMADARTLALPLVGSGEHDWEILFGQWGLLVHDRAIGSATRQLGWAGMLATVAWLVWMARRSIASRGQVSHPW
ncbi:MAG TPA: hypothetical protein VHM88_09470 [Candidatus Acidoferrales bacterium]|nr:hypothetical protein [Candidatus Acidoferrales bacterium]